MRRINLSNDFWRILTFMQSWVKTQSISRCDGDNDMATWRMRTREDLSVLVITENFNSLDPGRWGCNLKLVHFKLILKLVFWAFPWNCFQMNGMHKTYCLLVNIDTGNSLVLSDNKPVPEPSWPSSLTPYGVTRPSELSDYARYVWWNWFICMT